MHKEQNSNWDENDKKESNKKKKPVFNNNTTKSIFAIWIIFYTTHKSGYFQTLII